MIMRTSLEGSIYKVDGKEFLCVKVDGEACVTVNQLAEMSNYTPKSVRCKIKSGVIPMVKMDNGRVLIKVREVERLIEDGVLIKNICA